MPHVPTPSSRVIANHADFGHGIGAVADQGGALDRRTDLAVFDEVGLGCGKHELPGGDVDLAATEIDSVNSLLHRGDDFIGAVRAILHEGVCHSWHRRMLMRLTTPVAGRLDTHEPCVLAVLHIAAKDPVLDQHIAARLGSLIVDRDRPTTVLHRAVIDNRDALGRDLFANTPAEDRGPLAVEIALKPMPHGLVKHDAGPTRTKRDFHFAGRRRDGIQVQGGDAKRLSHLRLPDLGRHVIVEHDTATGAGGSRFHAPVTRHNNGYVEPHKRPDIGRPVPIRADDLHGLPGSCQRRADLDNPRVGGACEGVDLLKQGHLVLEGRAGQRVAVAVKRPVACRHRRLRRRSGIAAGYSGHTLGRALQSRLADVACMRIAMRLIGNRPQSESACLVIAGAFQTSVIEHQHFGMPHFKKQLTVICVDKRIAHDGLGAIKIERRVVEENRIGGGKMVHENSSPWPGHLQLSRQ